jgi:predicted nucleic acid-binding protein
VLHFSLESALLNLISIASDRQRLHYLWRPILLDADDEMVLETALNGQAQSLITFNQKHLAQAAKHLGIEPLPPAQFAQQLRQHTH